MKKSILIILSIILFIGCNKEQSYDDRIAGDLSISENEGEPINLPTAKEVLDYSIKETVRKKIIKNGTLHLKIDNLEESKTRIDSLVSVYDAYYSNESKVNSDNSSSINLKIRIPHQHFETFVTKVEEGKGEVTYKNINAKDVTEEFIDLESRLSNKKSYLTRYKELLKQAKSVKDILEIEDKVRVIEEEIESVEGRLKYLSDLVQLSTLELILTKEYDFRYRSSRRASFFERLKQSVANGWHGFIDFILLLLKLWPFFIIALITIFIIRKYKKRKV